MKSVESAVVISPFFSPEPISSGRYNAALVSSLVSQDLDVTVITSHPFYPTWKPRAASPVYRGATVIRGGRWIRYPSSLFLRRVILEVWFSVFALWSFLHLKLRADRIIVILPPTLFAALLLLLPGVANKTVAVVHDLQSVLATRQKNGIYRIMATLIRNIEGFSLRRCQRVAFVSNEMRQFAIDQFKLDPIRADFFYPFPTVTNDSRPNSAYSDPLAAELAAAPCFAYSGALSHKQSPDRLVECMLKVLHKSPSARAMIFSEGPAFDRIRRLYQHERLSFRPLVSEQQLPVLLKQAAVHFVVQADGTSSGCMPSKVTNLLVAGARILCITDENNELSGLLAEYPQAQVLHCWDANRVSNAALQLAGSDNTNDRNAALSDRFSIDALINYLGVGRHAA